jgi:ferredoxin
MIIEKIKDVKERERLLIVREGFPRDPAGGDPDLYCFPHDDMAYLPMDRVVEVNENIYPADGSVMPSDALAYFIEKASHRCIMNFCICREAMECKDYPIEYGCLFLGDAASRIHPELGRQVGVEEALEYARKCRDAGLIHLIGRDKLDILWLEIEPEEKLLTVCNCCPCCCLHRVAQHMPGESGKKVKCMPGVSIRVTDDCVACGTCVEEAVCIFNAIALGEDRAVINDPECRACGRCADICPESAIKITIDDAAYVDKTIKRFLEIVDIG